MRRAAVVFVYLASFAVIVVCPCIAAPLEPGDHGCCETPAGLNCATPSCCTAALGESNPGALQTVSFGAPSPPATLHVAAESIARPASHVSGRPDPILPSHPVLRI
ncbi:MAG: hypothetical protein ACHQNV_00810 [Vicinamibacteria bacterium]